MDAGMAEAIAIDRMRAERALRWTRATRAYAEASSAYARARAIYETSVRAPRPKLAVVPPLAPLVEAVPVVPTPMRSVSQGKRLTRRQHDIARLIAEGHTNRQIARELVLTEGTVANHVRAILLRLGVRCRAQVAAWYVSAGGVRRS